MPKRVAHVLPYAAPMLAATAIILIVLVVPTTRASRDENTRESFRLPAQAPAPANNLPSAERIKLGQMLFFDPRLSGSDRVSCATCHNPSLGWSDGLPRGRGERMKALARATPSLVNVGFNTIQMWDGRAPNLEDQAWLPMLETTEMHGTQEHILLKLQSIPAYVTAFDQAYPGEGIIRQTVAKALANFERTIVSRDSPFDRWAAGDETAIDDSAKRGFTLFTGKANCAACHFGGNFSDQGFHNLGLKNTNDLGRYAVIPVAAMRGAFKTPTLRDVALGGPYMHNGMYRTLEQVIDHYNRGGDVKENLDPNMKPLGLSEQEKKDLVEFLRTLAGNEPEVILPRLPPSS